jgi:hypothetical protein
LATALGLGLALTGPGGARGQFSAGGSSFGQLNTGSVYGANTLGGIGYGPARGYGIRTGQIGPGYQSAGGLYGRSYAAARPQTTVALQPLYSAITSLPGWNGPTRSLHRRVHRRPAEPPIQRYDRDGKIRWPSTIPADPTSTALRQEADAAFLAVVRESQSTGHASIRPVIDAKNKLSAFEHKILPEVKARNVTDGNDLDRFFVDLDRSLDAMNSVFY